MQSRAAAHEPRDDEGRGENRSGHTTHASAALFAQSNDMFEITRYLLSARYLDDNCSRS